MNGACRTPKRDDNKEEEEKNDSDANRVALHRGIYGAALCFHVCFYTFLFQRVAREQRLNT